MNGTLFLLLCCAACALLAVGKPGWKEPHKLAIAARGSRTRRARPPGPEELPRLVRQIAALLSVGRTGSILWSAVGHVLAAERNRGLQLKERAAQRAPGGNSHQDNARAGPETAAQDATLMLVLAVERASGLGLPTALAVRSACHVLGTQGKFHRNGKLTPAQQRMWLDLAACFEVCEASGAPVAQVLERLAATLEAEQDAAALRETALAGPRATVRLLNWLPFLGLGLGILMGVDPFAVLLGGPGGWALLAAGVLLVFAGRAWSARMIAAAAQATVSNRKKANGPVAKLGNHARRR